MFIGLPDLYSDICRHISVRVPLIVWKKLVSLLKFYVSEVPSPKSLIGLSSLHFLPLRGQEIMVILCSFLSSLLFFEWNTLANFLRIFGHEWRVCININHKSKKINNYKWDTLFIHIFTYCYIRIISEVSVPKKFLNSTY